MMALHCLCRCWAMPPLGFWPQTPLLAQFQRIVELHESRRLLLELVRANQRPDYDYKELKVALCLQMMQV